MNNVSHLNSIPTASLRPKAARVRTYRAALQEPGASRLTTEETAIVTQALVILENKVMRKLGDGEILKSPERVKQWLRLHYGMLRPRSLRSHIPRRPLSVPRTSATVQRRHPRRVGASPASGSLGVCL